MSGVVKSKILRIAEELQIVEPTDWANVHASEILAMHDVGEQTLNQLRLQLADAGLTLKDDETPAYWQSMFESRNGKLVQRSSQTRAVSPFVILVDTGEQQPFTFGGIRDSMRRPLTVRTRRQFLGHSNGDYMIEGMEGFAHIERKSQNDCISTVLSVGDRQDNFRKTLTRLASVNHSLVVVECTIETALKGITARGSKSVVDLRKQFVGQLLAYQSDYGVQWMFYDSRPLAELMTYRFFSFVWRRDNAAKKHAANAGVGLESM
jgi:hypothetical protein